MFDQWVFSDAVVDLHTFTYLVTMLFVEQPGLHRGLLNILLIGVI